MIELRDALNIRQQILSKKAVFSVNRERRKIVAKVNKRILSKFVEENARPLNSFQAFSQ